MLSRFAAPLLFVMLASAAQAQENNLWGAVAYTADGAFGGAYGMESRSKARRMAIAQCRRQSTERDDCSRGVVVRRDSWFHIMFCIRDGSHTTHITTRSTLNATSRSAEGYARRSKYGVARCRTVLNGLFHSGGRHTRM